MHLMTTLAKSIESAYTGYAAADNCNSFLLFHALYASRSMRYETEDDDPELTKRIQFGN